MIWFRTNLDEAQRDVLSLPELDSATVPVPRKGERIIFPFEREGRKFSYALGVVDVAYEYAFPIRGSFTTPAIRVELHIDPHQSGMTINEWTKWFNKHRWGREW